MIPAVGDDIRIAEHAPAHLRPGEPAVVVHVRRLDDEGTGCAVCRGDGGVVLRVRFDDGGEQELPDRLVRPRR